MPGFRQVEITPFTAQISALTPAPKSPLIKVFQVSRTDTVASLKAVLPFDSSILSVFSVGAASDATTSAVLSIGTSSTSNEIVNGMTVTVAGKTVATGAVWANANPAVVDVGPAMKDVQIYAKYTGVGTETVGGPWKVVVEYV